MRGKRPQQRKTPRRRRRAAAAAALDAFQNVPQKEAAVAVVTKGLAQTVALHVPDRQKSKTNHVDA
jgi:hypothetical protein